MKHSKVRWNPARIKRLYKGGKNVSEIAQAIGYPLGHGNNRTRNLLVAAGLYAVSEARSPESKPKAKK
jgi:hypothetical protein